ncbi:RadC family protein [Thiothrix subterranea]|uniref:DNA repair protein RadC n=2 Tax=Thiothrix subterranea TaxID=2735563 RepID=A0AA51MLA0_9GAMM|nr:DNA repair protein RadC [Thiothrix subterranea]MDQ5767942.1 DNA repair protein RadC [Thiothrix subterranea]WML86599.1 DNA repair protein RadC [Thiothrix subterranea]
MTMILTPRMTQFVLEDSGKYRIHGEFTADEILEAASGIALQALSSREGLCLTDPDVVRHYLCNWLGNRKAEVFGCLFLDNRHRLIAAEELFFGTIDGASVHPREVVRDSLRHNAAAVVFVHNHPSGVVEPSQADERITQKLKDALHLIDVRVLDHFVVGSDNILSFAERGLL